MRVFFDFEMTGLHQHTTPVSLGMVAESGQMFYAEFADYDRSQIDEWLQKNVIDNLILGHAEEKLVPGPDGSNLIMASMTGHPRSEKWTILGARRHIQIAVIEWLNQFYEVQMWGDVLAYDWMLFCELFEIPEGKSAAERLPANIYYIPFDIATLMEAKGVDPDISREEFVIESSFTVPGLNKHNALYDALTIKRCHKKLMEL